MHSAEIRNNDIYVKDLSSGNETKIWNIRPSHTIVSVVVSGEDKVTATYDSGLTTDYRISTASEYH